MCLVRQEYGNRRRPHRGRRDPLPFPVADLHHLGLVSGTARDAERGADEPVGLVADVAGLKTTWCRDPWGTVIILLEKSEEGRPYWGQLMP